MQIIKPIFIFVSAAIAAISIHWCHLQESSEVAVRDLDSAGEKQPKWRVGTAHAQLKAHQEVQAAKRLAEKDRKNEPSKRLFPDLNNYLYRQTTIKPTLFPSVSACDTNLGQPNQHNINDPQKKAKNTPGGAEDVENANVTAG